MRTIQICVNTVFYEQDTLDRNFKTFTLSSRDGLSKENVQIGKSSDFYEDVFEVCEPCSVEVRRLKAKRFCVDCHEFLCQKCSAHHKALKAIRNHVLITVHAAKNAKPKTAKDKCNFKCTSHKEKRIKFFCVSHSLLGCSVCITIDHKQCKNIDYIPKMAEGIKDDDSFKKFNEELKSLETTCKSSIADVEKNLKQMGTDERQLKEAIKEFRLKMNNSLDKFENELTAQAKTNIHEETDRLNAMSKKLTIHLSNVGELLNQIDTLMSRGKKCDTYVLMKKEARRLVDLNNEIVNATKGKTYQRYEFQSNNEIYKVGAFGKLNTRSENVSSSSENTVAKQYTDGLLRSEQIEEKYSIHDVWDLSDRCHITGLDSSRNIWQDSSRNIRQVSSRNIWKENWETLKRVWTTGRYKDPYSWLDIDNIHPDYT